MCRVSWVTLFVWISMFPLFSATAEHNKVIDISANWRFCPDPDNSGIILGWHRTDFADSDWATVKAGPWEEEGFDNVDGACWYRMELPSDLPLENHRIWLNLGGINDYGVIFCNNHKIASFGDEKISFAQVPITVELTPFLRRSGKNVLAIRVVDIGRTGGILPPCTLTNDPSALVIHKLLMIVPGFCGRPTVIGIPITGVDSHTPSPPSIQLELIHNGQPVPLENSQLSTDYAGTPWVTARTYLDLNPGDELIARAETVSEPLRSLIGVPIEQKYIVPKPPRWKGHYSRLRVLNNFVTELKRVPIVLTHTTRIPFSNPRDGWVHIGVTSASPPRGKLVNLNREIVWRKHPETAAYEAMLYLKEGRHVLHVEDVRRAEINIRAVPEIAFCYWPTGVVLKGLPARDRKFGETYVFPNANVLLTHDDMTEEEFEMWRAEGRRWISNSSLPGLQEETPPSADDVYRIWEQNACLRRSGYSGIIVDEFLNKSGRHYAAWTEATERLIRHPAFAGQTFYAWVVNTYRHPPGLEYMRKLYDWGGRFAWERYLREEPHEDIAWTKIYSEIVMSMEEWELLMPELRSRLLICLGSFCTPSCSLNINPQVDFLAYMDMQFHLLATDPHLFNIYGIFQWAAHYTDDDALRFAQRLYRHYCIEGNTKPYSNRAYQLTHVINADFEKGLEEWTVENAEEGSILAGSRPGLGMLQGRWIQAGIGDTCAIFIRSGNKPNRLTQTIKNLLPGKIYSLKFIAADLDNLTRQQEVGLFAELKDVEILPEKSFRSVMPSSYAVKFENFDKNNPAYTTYCQVVFQAKNPTCSLAFTDWENGKPAGEIGQRIALNFVEVLPYYANGKH